MSSILSRPKTIVFARAALACADDHQIGPLLFLRSAQRVLGTEVRLTGSLLSKGRRPEHYGVLADRLGAAGVAPTTTMLGVTRLAIPGQTVELEGTAVA